MLKFFSKRFAKSVPQPNSGSPKRNFQTSDRNEAPVRPGDPNFLECHVVMLDGDEVLYMIHRKSLGHELYDKVCFNLELYEKDYFGLHYTDTYSIHHWLDPTKQIKKQITIAKKCYTLHLRVKFFPSQPNNVKEELTKYMLYLQLKQDVKDGKLPVPVDLSVDLSSLVVQAELGDFDAGEHDIGLVSEFRFLPVQSEQYEERVFAQWAQLRGLNPALCEDKYLNKVKDVEMYGVSMHEVFGKDGNLYRLGLTPFGMLIFDNGVRIGLFFWQKMDKLAFKQKRLIIEVVETDEKGEDRLHMFQFTLNTSSDCKYLWKCAVEYHTFYRMKANAGYIRPRQSFVRMGSRFRYSGRTEAQMKASAKTPQPKRQVQFERRPSKRYTRRESYRIRQKLTQNQDESSVRVASTSQLSLNLSSNAPSSHTNLNLIEFSPSSHNSHQISNQTDRNTSRTRLYSDDDGSAPVRPPLPPSIQISDSNGRLPSSTQSPTYSDYSNHRNNSNTSENDQSLLPRERSRTSLPGYVNDNNNQRARYLDTRPGNTQRSVSNASAVPVPPTRNPESFTSTHRYAYENDGPGGRRSEPKLAKQIRVTEL